MDSKFAYETSFELVVETVVDEHVPKMVGANFQTVQSPLSSVSFVAGVALSGQPSSVVFPKQLDIWHNDNPEMDMHVYGLSNGCERCAVHTADTEAFFLNKKFKNL